MQGKLVLVTGGNRGLGLELCKKTLQRGARVILTARNPEAGKQAAGELEKTTGRIGCCTFLPLDTADPSSINNLVSSVKQKYNQGIHILVNNAGIYPQGWSETEFQEAYATNYQGPVELACKLAPHLAPGGTIVMVSSGFGQKSCLTPDYLQLVHTAPDLQTLAQVGFKQDSPMKSEYVAAYKVSKNMLNRSVQLLATDPLLRERNITINAVSPGWCRTDMGGDNAGRSAEQGADSIMWVGEHGSEVTGGFYMDGGEP